MGAVLHENVGIRIWMSLASRQVSVDFGNLREELSAIFGRRVDLVSRHGLSPHIGPQILREARLFYAVE